MGKRKLNKIDINSFTSIDEQIAKLIAQKNVNIEKAIYSDDPNEVIAAQSYIQKIKDRQKKNSPDVKSWLFLPDDYGYTGSGYKQTIKSVSFENLKSISKLFVVKLVTNTRLDQIKNFLAFTTDEQREGFTIRKRKGLFDEGDKKLTKSEQKRITEIVLFLESCGKNSKWDNYDDFPEFITKILTDSLTYDQLGFEVIRNRGGELNKFLSVDASMIRLLDSVDSRYREEFNKMEVNGYVPKYGMVYNQQLLRNPVTNQLIIYYPWELGYGIRNKVTDVRSNGYGLGELETGIELITWILWSFQYNSNFFKQGSQPKGFINVKDGNLDNTTLNEFRNSWRQMMTGVQNSHKTPVFEGIDLEWIDLQTSNREMEYQQWMEFLLVVFCSLYKIDPTELGFSFQKAANIFGQDGQKERLQHSRSKGLKPLLVFLEKIINKYIVSELDGTYEFKFTGIDIEAEEAQVRLDGEKLKEGMVSFEDMFKKYSGREYDEKKDTILNQIHMQIQGQKQMGGDEMNGQVEEYEDEEYKNPFEEFSKSSEIDPIIKEATNFFNKAFTKN